MSSSGDSKRSIELLESMHSAEIRTYDPTNSAAQERRLVRKLDMRIMPMLCMMYLFACKSTTSLRTSLQLSFVFYSDLDRINLGNARLQGLPQDVLHGDPTGVLFDWVNSAFYFSYVRRTA